MCLEGIFDCVLREEERFSNIEKLIAKIQKDKEHTLRILLSQ